MQIKIGNDTLAICRLRMKQTRNNNFIKIMADDREGPPVPGCTWHEDGYWLMNASPIVTTHLDFIVMSYHDAESIESMLEDNIVTVYEAGTIRFKGQLAVVSTSVSPTNIFIVELECLGREV